MDVLCVDKTGTITMNQLAVTYVIPLEHAKEADVLITGALASQEANQDPIDLAFLAAAKAHHVFDDGSPVLGDDTEQAPRWGAYGGRADWHYPDLYGSAGSHAIALVAAVRNFPLCNGVLPCRE